VKKSFSVVDVFDFELADANTPESIKNEQIKLRMEFMFAAVYKSYIFNSRVW
jgi:hypothetical protein